MSPEHALQRHTSCPIPTTALNPSPTPALVTVLVPATQVQSPRPGPVTSVWLERQPHSPLYLVGPQPQALRGPTATASCPVTIDTAAGRAGVARAGVAVGSSGVDSHRAPSLNWQHALRLALQLADLNLSSPHPAVRREGRSGWARPLPGEHEAPPSSRRAPRDHGGSERPGGGPALGQH